MDWFPIPDAAEILGIRRQVLHKAIVRTLASPEYLYRGHRLVVRKVRGTGGRSGECYEVLADSLPHSSLLALKPSYTHLEKPLRHDDKATWERNFWCEICRHIIVHPPHSRARGRAVAEAARRTYTGYDGKPVRYSAKSISDRARELKNKGVAGLAVKKRADAGKRKAIVTLQFDAAARAADINDAQLTLTAEKLRRYIRSLIAADMTFKKVAFLAQCKINDLAEALGIASGHNSFTVPDHLINKERRFRNVARYRRDRKAHNDAAPHITRTIAGLQPMDIINHLRQLPARLIAFAGYSVLGLSWIVSHWLVFFSVGGSCEADTGSLMLNLPGLACRSAMGALLIAFDLALAALAFGKLRSTRQV